MVLYYDFNFNEIDEKNDRLHDWCCFAYTLRRVHISFERRVYECHGAWTLFLSSTTILRRSIVD